MACKYSKDLQAHAQASNSLKNTCLLQHSNVYFEQTEVTGVWGDCSASLEVFSTSRAKELEERPWDHGAPLTNCMDKKRAPEGLCLKQCVCWAGGAHSKRSGVGRGREGQADGRRGSLGEGVDMGLFPCWLSTM